MFTLRFWLSFWLVSISCIQVMAWPPCGQAFVNTLPPKIVEINRSHQRISKILPEYDPQKDFLYHFYPDGHVVFYTAGFFMDSNVNEAKPGENIISQGVSIRVRVGKKTVQKIVNNIKRTVTANCRYAYTCHQRIIFLLNASGIYTAKGPHLFGSSLMDSLIQDGFVDARGKKYLHQVHVISLAGVDHRIEIRRTIQSYELGGGHVFFDSFSNKLGYTPQEMKADILAHARNPDISHCVNVMGDPPTYSAFPQELKDLAHKILLTAEAKLIKQIEMASGKKMRELFPLFLETGTSEYIPWLKDKFRESFIESVKELD